MVAISNWPIKISFLFFVRCFHHTWCHSECDHNWTETEEEKQTKFGEWSQCSNIIHMNNFFVAHLTRTIISWWKYFIMLVMWWKKKTFHWAITWANIQIAPIWYAHQLRAQKKMNPRKKDHFASLCLVFIYDNIFSKIGKIESSLYKNNHACSCWVNCMCFVCHLIK